MEKKENGNLIKDLSPRLVANVMHWECGGCGIKCQALQEQGPSRRPYEEKGIQKSALPSMGVSQKYGHLYSGPHNKDYSVWGSVMGSKLPSQVQEEKLRVL